MSEVTKNISLLTSLTWGWECSLETTCRCCCIPQAAASSSSSSSAAAAGEAEISGKGGSVHGSSRPSVRPPVPPQVSQVEAGSLAGERGSQADRTSYFGGGSGRCRPRPVGRRTDRGEREGLSVDHLPVQSREQEMLVSSVSQSDGKSLSARWSSLARLVGVRLVAAKAQKKGREKGERVRE